MTSFNQNLADSFVRFIFTLLLNKNQNNLMMRNHKCPSVITTLHCNANLQPSLMIMVYPEQIGGTPKRGEGGHVLFTQTQTLIQLNLNCIF